MGTIGKNCSDDEFSEIGEKPEMGFLDFEDDKSLHSYDALEEGPVVITVPFPFVGGKPQSALIGETLADTISIKNTSCEPIELWSVRIFSSNPEDSYVLSLMKPPSDDANEEAIRAFVGLTYLEERTIQPGQTLTIWLSCKPTDIGLHTSIVHFDIGDEKIERVAFLLADDHVSKALFSDKPYSRAHSQKKKFQCDQYVPGCRPARQHMQGFKYKLPRFAIPSDIRELIESKEIPDVIHEELTGSNYAKFFSTLLVMEEINLEEEMRAYDMESVSMKRRGNNFLSLVVPGLAERRPSLVYGDFILARLANDDQNDAHPYQGFIHKVEADQIFLRFDKLFHLHHQAGNLYNVSFTYNRLNMRRLYKAIHDAECMGPEILFPCLSSYRRLRKLPFKPLNPNINSEQADAVGMILGCRGVPPYVIYGPPGTGKTMTLVEAILQLYTTRKKARILLCASSNSAADHVLEKLLDVKDTVICPNEIFRLNATSRPYEDVNPDFARFCFFEDMVFKCPPLKALMQYRIIISTYMSASLLQAEGIRRRHFSHVFLDEAGQASEPEAMVPLSSLCARDTVVVLAGDPMQLGPVVYSREAEKYGLGRSYLERLADSEYYAKGDPNYVIKLVRNYRCHPAILELPSKLFYGGELIACKEDYVSSIYDSIDLPSKSFPVLFLGIQGCDEREGNNPSWFNRIEASKVVDTIRKLMRNGDICEDDIGIITPYRQQVLKLKKALESFEMPDLKVGSVEQFQGQERQVIIISTVRSTVKHNEFDKAFNLGFLRNYRRFNVAITRAKSLLIIIGNPHIITKDRNWDRLLRYCSDNGSYRGCPLPPPEFHFYPEAEPTVYDYNQEDSAAYDYNQEESAAYDYNQQESAAYDYNQQESAIYDYNQEEPTACDYKQDAGPSYTKNEVKWCEEKPNEHPPYTNNEEEWYEETLKEHSNEAKQYDAPEQCSNDETWVQGSSRHCFPVVWGDVYHIQATGWDD